MITRVLHKQQGAALVEFAICAALLLILLFGIFDAALLLTDRQSVAAGAREAARSLAVGSAPAVAINRAMAATSLPLTSADVTLQEAAPNADGTPGPWSMVGTASGENDAASGDFVEATVSYSHPLITSLVFSGGTFPLTASLVMRRE